jgi:hypothetical protein
MRIPKVKLNPILKPLDLNLPVLLKIISDLHAVLKNLSPLASLAFILLNLKRLFVSWKPLITVALLVPALIIMPSFDIVRFMMSVCILWIYLDKLNNPDREYSVILGWIIVIYVLAMTIGIMNPSFYLIMDTNAMRYKFIMESHNALTITALICLVYLVNLFITKEESGSDRWLKWASYISILFVCIVFLFVKSRIYIGISFGFLLLIAIKKFRQSRALALAPVLYIVFFLCITIAGSIPAEQGTEPGLNIFDNNRVMSSSGTGRGKLVNAFLKTFREQGWQHFLYQNNVKAYYENKLAIPDINMSVSTLTESSYLVILLYAGFLGLLVFLFIFAHYLWRFYKRKEYLSLAFMLLLLGAWLLEETILFPLSLISHLFALATVNYLETKKYESSPNY